MAVDLRIELHPNYLEAVVVGMISPADAQNIFVEILKASNAHQQPLILLDWRQVTLTSPLTTLRRFEFASFVAEKTIHVRARGLAGIRMAFLADTKYLDPRRFGETVATNRGIALKVADSMAEALAWLGVEPPESP